LLAAGLGLVRVGQTSAQTYRVLHEFTATSDTNYTGSDGALPNDWGGLARSGNSLYGTTIYGGVHGLGTVFAVNINGTGFTNLHSFTGASGGERPYASLIVSGNALFGSTDGGNLGLGTVFKLNTDGTGFTVLHNFGSVSPRFDSEGAYPVGLVLSSNMLYGLAAGGRSGGGLVFKIGTDGTGFTNVYNFTGAIASSPNALIILGDTLYGTTEGGGTYGYGMVFALTTDGTDFAILHSFTAASAPYNTNSDGAWPAAGLVLGDSALYGTTSGGGISGSGTVFRLNMDGTGFLVMHSLAALACWEQQLDVICTNSEGANLQAGLVLSGNTLYGTANGGGSSGYGTVFAINTDGTGFTNLYSFTGGDDGRIPSAGLIAAGRTLYGAAEFGGASGYGTVFSLSLVPPPPQLTIALSEAQVVLTWPAVSGFTLQSTTNLVSPVWTTNVPAPVVIKDQYTVTNSIAGAQRFFRLSK
jgi:uncharacterized repeat protein (TIGR03803 family)